MAPTSNMDKPHAVCIPYPAQGHINPMLKLAKLLHHRGFHITFVHSEYNKKRLLRARGPNALDGLPSFQFETIPDGLPPAENVDTTQDIPSLCESTSKYGLVPFRELLTKLNEDAASSNGALPPVSCVVADGIMTFTITAAEELGIPEVLLWTASACGYLAYEHYSNLVEKDLFPLKDEKDLSSGYLNTPLDWIPSMQGIRLKDMPSFIRTTNPHDIMVNFALKELERARRSSAIIFNTFQALEHDVLLTLSSIFPPIYDIGPLLFLENYINDNKTDILRANLWKEDISCLRWLDLKEPNSVVYVNFGSITVMTQKQLTEFSWGLANSGKTFLWIIRPDLVVGDSCDLPVEFIEATKNRGLLASWCQQEKVLSHKSIGGFLTHNGWNSTLESISNGVPMICWPFFADQQTNCWFCCEKWGIGMEIESDVKRDEVEVLVRELMDGEKRKEMKRNAMEWKKKAEESCDSVCGSSCMNFEKMINKILSPK